MSDSRGFVRMTLAGYQSIPVPDAVRANRGRMYDEQEPPQEVVPTFEQYLDHLRHPGGRLRHAEVAGVPYVVFGIPNITGAELEALRDVAIANGKTLPDVWLSTPEAIAFLEQFATDNGGAL